MAASVNELKWKLKLKSQHNRTLTEEIVVKTYFLPTAQMRCKVYGKS